VKFVVKRKERGVNMELIIIQRSLKMRLGILLIILLWSGSTLASENYALVAEWPANGAGLAIDSERNIYVSDTGPDRIQKFTSEGDFITSWGNYGSGDGEFIGPWGIDVDSEGSVYVADMGNDRVQKFTSDGEFIAKWSTKVEGIWMYSMPQGVAVDNAGFVYVQHTSVTPPALIYSCIQKFTSEGVFIKKWVYWWGIAFEMTTDNENNVYAPGTFFGPLQKFTPEGKLVDEWGICSIKEVFCSSTGIALDSEDNVFVSDAMHHNVKKFTSDGEHVISWDLQSSGGFGSPPAPYGLAVDNEGYVYVKVSDTTTTTKGPCPSEVALQGNSYQLQTIRDFRDGVLATTPRGNDYIDIYYQHSSEVSLLLLSDEGLRTKARKLLVDFLPTIESLLGDEEVVLSEELIIRIESLLDEIGSKAGPKLRAEIRKVQREIGKTDFPEQLGIAFID
jgi:DNA-binding beta-propeller fold protein YncE